MVTNFQYRPCRVTVFSNIFIGFHTLYSIASVRGTTFLISSPAPYCLYWVTHVRSFQRDHMVPIIGRVRCVPHIRRMTRFWAKVYNTSSTRRNISSSRTVKIHLKEFHFHFHFVHIRSFIEILLSIFIFHDPRDIQPIALFNQISLQRRNIWIWFTSHAGYLSPLMFHW